MQMFQAALKAEAMIHAVYEHLGLPKYLIHQCGSKLEPKCSLQLVRWSGPYMFTHLITLFDYLLVKIHSPTYSQLFLNTKTLKLSAVALT